MKKKINITIENKLLTDKRAMNVYHHSTRSAHMISHNSAITIPLKSVVDDDYLHISIVSGPGKLKNNSVVNLPAWSDFEFSSVGDVKLIHSGERTLLKIPPGLSGWQLKMTRAAYRPDIVTDNITISDEQINYR